MDTVTVQLSKPLKTHQGELTELVLKPATVRSFISHGAPYTVTADNTVAPDYKAIFGFVSDMTGIDRLTLNDIAGRDVLPIFNALLEMLLVRPQNG